MVAVAIHYRLLFFRSLFVGLSSAKPISHKSKAKGLKRGKFNNRRKRVSTSVGEYTDDSDAESPSNQDGSVDFEAMSNQDLSIRSRQSKSKEQKGKRAASTHQRRSSKPVDLGDSHSSDSEHVSPSSGPLLRIPTYETESENEDNFVPPEIQEKSDNELSHAAKSHNNVIIDGQPQSQSIHSTIFAKQISVPVSSQISSKIKRQIWANKYIDFALLLPSYSVQPKQQKFTPQLAIDSTFNLITQSHTHKITYIAQWTSAFLRFVAVYTEKFQQEAPQLMKYGEFIRDLAYRRPGLAWYNYNMQFRQLRESVAYSWT